MNISSVSEEYGIYGMLFSLSNRIQTIGDKEFEVITMKQHFMMIDGVAFYYAASISFGITYNQLFLAYVALFSCLLFGMMMHIKKIAWNQTIKITKGLKIFLILSGTAVLVAWLPDIIPTVINGGTLSLMEVYTTEITYVLDILMIWNCTETSYCFRHFGDVRKLIEKLYNVNPLSDMEKEEIRIIPKVVICIVGIDEIKPYDRWNDRINRLALIYSYN